MLYYCYAIKFLGYCSSTAILQKSLVTATVLLYYKVSWLLLHDCYTRYKVTWLLIHYCYTKEFLGNWYILLLYYKVTWLLLHYCYIKSFSITDTLLLYYKVSWLLLHNCYTKRFLGNWYITAIMQSYLVTATLLVY